VEEESTISFEDNFEALQAELDSRQTTQNVGYSARLTAKVVDESEMEKDSVYMSPTSGRTLSL
jgi:hypothetical protein